MQFWETTIIRHCIFIFYPLSLIYLIKLRALSLDAGKKIHYEKSDQYSPQYFHRGFYASSQATRFLIHDTEARSFGPQLGIIRPLSTVCPWRAVIAKRTRSSAVTAPIIGARKTYTPASVLSRRRLRPTSPFRVYDDPKAALRISFRRRLTTAPGLSACAPSRPSRRYGPAARPPRANDYRGVVDWVTVDVRGGKHVGHPKVLCFFLGGGEKGDWLLDRRDND